MWEWVPFRGRNIHPRHLSIPYSQLSPQEKRRKLESTDTSTLVDMIERLEDQVSLLTQQVSSSAVLVPSAQGAAYIPTSRMRRSTNTG